MKGFKVFSIVEQDVPASFSERPLLAPLLGSDLERVAVLFAQSNMRVSQRDIGRFASEAYAWFEEESKRHRYIAAVNAKQRIEAYLQPKEVLGGVEVLIWCLERFRQGFIIASVNRGDSTLEGVSPRLSWMPEREKQERAA